ncbi:MAG TPA: anti-sigma factor [Opitutaceae bacterium]|jgi:anti-sigma-K factor RskA
MIDERQEELAALHALGLLEGAEHEEFVAELARSPELRSRVAQLRQASASLAHMAPPAEPPAELKARILASAAGRRAATDAPWVPGARRSVAPAPSPARVVPFPAWVPWLAAACLALATFWSQRQYRAVRAENEGLRAQERLAETALDEARGKLADADRRVADSGRQVAELDAKLKSEGDLAHFKIATLASMLGNTPAALAVAVWDPSREEGVLSVSKLPAVAPAKDYQLWVIDSEYAAPVSAGTFAVDPVTGDAHVVFRADKPVHSIAKFAVSVERKGGAPTPEGPIVLLGQ